MTLSALFLPLYVRKLKFGALEMFMMMMIITLPQAPAKTCDITKRQVIGVKITLT